MTASRPDLDRRVVTFADLREVLEAMDARCGQHAANDRDEVLIVTDVIAHGLRALDAATRQPVAETPPDTSRGPFGGLPWSVCLKCQKPVALVSDRFCENCGNDLRTPPEVAQPCPVCEWIEETGASVYCKEHGTGTAPGRRESEPCLSSQPAPSADRQPTQATSAASATAASASTDAAPATSPSRTTNPPTPAADLMAAVEAWGDTAEANTEEIEAGYQRVKAAATACVAECERLEFNLGVLKTNYHGLEQEIERLRLEEKVGRGYATLLAEAENKNEIAGRAYAGMVEGRRREQEKREKAEAALEKQKQITRDNTVRAQEDAGRLIAERDAALKALAEERALLATFAARFVKSQSCMTTSGTFADAMRYFRESALCGAAIDALIHANAMAEAILNRDHDARVKQRQPEGGK